jgi:hypothetical protein
MPKIERSGEVAGVFLTKKHSTDDGHGGDIRCPGVCWLTLSMAWIEGGDRRCDGWATDADVSVCWSVHKGSFDAQEWRTRGLAFVWRVRRLVRERVEVSRPLEINDSYLKWDMWQQSSDDGTGAIDAGSVCRWHDKHICHPWNLPSKGTNDYIRLWAYK